MRQLIALSLGVVLLAGCASTNDPSDPEVAEPAQATEDDASDDDEPGNGATDADVQTPTEDDEPNEAAADGEGDDADATEVSIGDFFFDPETTSVAVGDTITWIHEGDITHNVTARDDSFVSDNLSGGDTFTHTFDTPGSFEYRCTLHGQMVATVEVNSSD